MPHVSSRKLSQKVILQMDRVIDSFLLEAATGRRKDSFRELFTKTERLMVAKRLMIVYLLHKSVSAYKIWNMLGVSPSTVTRFERLYEQGRFKRLSVLLRSDTPTQRALRHFAELVLIPLTTKGKTWSEVWDGE